MTRLPDRGDAIEQRREDRRLADGNYYLGISISTRTSWLRIASARSRLSPLGAWGGRGQAGGGGKLGECFASSAGRRPPR